MKGALKVMAAAAIVLALSAVLAPLLHDLLPYPFPRILKRLVMIGAILAIVLIVKVRRSTVVRVGLAWTPASARLAATGFVTGLAALTAFALLSVAAGTAEVAIRQLAPAQWARRVAEGLLSGMLIGFLEEFLFRGAIFTWMRDAVFRGRLPGAIVATSLLYAALHFLNVSMPAVGPDPGLADSVRLILAPVRALADWPALWPSAVGLFLFGLILNGCVVRTGSLYPSIGLHAGTVTFLRLSGLFLTFGGSDTLIWSSKRVYDGVLGWVFLLIVGALLALFLKKADSAS